MSLTKIVLLATFALAPFAASAQQMDLQTYMNLASNSCSAPENREYFCPDEGMGYQGPYYDKGCSVTCGEGQKAVCHEATCDDNQNGQQVHSSCKCD